MTDSHALRENKHRVSIREVVSWVVSVTVALALLTVGLNWGIPYAPTKLEVYETVPDVVCPGQETEVRTGFNVVKPPLGTVTGFGVDST